MSLLIPGNWPSELTEDQAVSASTGYSQLQYSDAGILFWVEHQPDQLGRNIIQSYSDNRVNQLTAHGYSVQSKVHEYGGRAWCLAGENIVFVNAEDQQLYLQSTSRQELPNKITDSTHSRFIEPVWDKYRNLVIAVEECHETTPVINRLVSVKLDSGEIEPLHQEFDFYAYPEISACGNYLIFVSWNHPYQPWISTQLSIERLDQLGALNNVSVVAGANNEEAISQPCFFDHEHLCYISDRSGWWNIYVASFEGEVIQHLDASADMMPAPWQSGVRNYQLIDGELIWVEQHQSGDQLLTRGRNISPDGYSQFRALATYGNSIACVAAGKNKLPQVISIPISGEDSTVITSNLMPLPTKELSQPIAMEFGEQVTCYGYFYPPRNSTIELLQLAPLVVFLHGGPTACSYPVLNFKIQYWTQRGFAVLDLNYRGSSGYGRYYRLALQGKWGELEVEDIKLSIEELVDQGLVDPQAIFIRGNSSGGFSALNAMCQLDIFAGGASLYGVTEPLSLAKVTHKFESHYLNWLIGDPVSDLDRYIDLAPVNHADKISNPVIFFQGKKDRVVVPEQTWLMIECITNNGIKIRALFFDDEAHGFRKRDNQITVLREELEFYQNIICSS